MNKTRKYIREAALSLLFVAAALTYFSYPYDEASPTWACDFLKGKLICALCIALMAVITRLWDENGRFRGFPGQEQY